MPPDGTPSRAGWYPNPEDPAQVRYWDGHGWTDRVGRRSTVLAVAMLTTPVLGFVLPVIGVGVSLAAAFWAVARGGAPLWRLTGATRRQLGVATVGFAALWLPGILQLSGVLYRVLGPEVSGRYGVTAWLLLPLGAPVNPWAPAAVAMVVYAIGAGASVLGRRPWPWVVGGLAASLAYDLTIRLASIESIA